MVAFAVAAWVTGAYWFTASTAFANPAVTLSRAVTDTFTGILSRDVPGFLLGQALGAAASIGLFRWLHRPSERSTSEQLLAPRPASESSR